MIFFIILKTHEQSFFRMLMMLILPFVSVLVELSLIPSTSILFWSILIFFLDSGGDSLNDLEMFEY